MYAPNIHLRAGQERHLGAVRSTRFVPVGDTVGVPAILRFASVYRAGVPYDWSIGHHGPHPALVHWRTGALVMAKGNAQGQGLATHVSANKV